MHLRPATADDANALLEVVQAAYRGRGGWTTEADLLEGQRTDRAGVEEYLPYLTVALDDDDVLVGCCALVPEGEHATFGMFAVRPGLQGGGVGSALLSAAEEQARAEGYPFIEMHVLSTRSELLAYYLRRGYVDTGASLPFPYGDERFGLPRTDGLAFAVLTKHL